MPIKLKPSTTRRDKVSRQLIMEHTYIKSQSIKVLLDMFNHQGTKPKVKQKIRREFDRRGLKLIYG